MWSRILSAQNYGNADRSAQLTTENFGRLENFVIAVDECYRSLSIWTDLEVMFKCELTFGSID